jgi:hypothetical protein
MAAGPRIHVRPRRVVAPDAGGRGSETCAGTLAAALRSALGVDAGASLHHVPGAADEPFYLAFVA